MNQDNDKPFDQKSIELLKAARNQVTLDRKGKDENQNILRTETPPTLQQEHPTIQSRFTENFIQKVASLEQAKVKVEQEIVKVEKLWSSVNQRKQQLENRRSELIKVKDKLIALDKEISNILNRNDL